MKNVVLALSLSALMPMCAIADHQISPLTKPMDLKTAQNKQVHYKFLIMAKKAEFKPMDHNHYSLTLFGPSVVHYRAMAPHKEAGNISLAKFAEYWQASEPGDNFKKDPPNAFVASNEPQEKTDGTMTEQLKPYVVILKKATYDKQTNTIHFDCTVEQGGQPLKEGIKMKDVALIVDNFSVPTW